eukprot:TRINITY_DN3932_c0_g1_i2.p1 TRINITY_DN3932_c0_g1~~TRINITY_DN3932_c0_g1_i2.p1  ORF type:complete len:758 (-),score=242.09 TRINITY_DN3932_c0_g1_i2:202-2475(-)
MYKAPTTLENVWPALEDGMSKLLNEFCSGIPFSEWMTLYTHVHDYCTSSRTQRVESRNGACFGGEDLYAKLVHFLEQHLSRILSGSRGLMELSLLRYYRLEWEKYTQAMKRVNNMFQYLNRHWIKREAEDGTKDVYEVYPLSLVLWREKFFVDVHKRITEALLDQIQRDRDGEDVDTSLLKVVIDSYVSQGLTAEQPPATTTKLYREFFEEAFLEDTQLYFSNEAVAFLDQNSITDYLRKVESRLAQESRRVRTYLHTSTHTRLLSSCEHVLIFNHLDALHAEIPQLLAEEKDDDLGRMYVLLSAVEGGLARLRTAFEKHVLEQGLNAVANIASQVTQDPRVYVEALLKVYRKYETLVATAFRRDSRFPLVKAARRFVNANAITAAASSAKSPELVARFADQILRKSNRTDDAHEIETLLDDIMVVFKLMEERDVFMSFYSKRLAHRLINNTFASEDLERIMIEKLKSACGFEYTAKLQRMFQDISLSRDINEDFREHAAKPAVDFSMLVLTTGSWPLAPAQSAIDLPAPLAQSEKCFRDYYCNKHSGRKLNMLYRHSKVEVVAHCFHRVYVLQCSTFQATVLALFNATSMLSAEQMAQRTKLSEPILFQTLMTLVKTRILNSKPSMIVKTEGADGQMKASLAEPTLAHLFAVNKQFKRSAVKVNINIQIGREKDKESTEAHKTVEDDRKFHIQAAIVRVMKMRKEMKHTALLAEVIQQLQSRFQPQVPVIKRCIEMLIEKEYIQRSSRSDVYQYLA